MGSSAFRQPQEHCPGGLPIGAGSVHERALRAEVPEETRHSARVRATVYSHDGSREVVRALFLHVRGRLRGQAYVTALHGSGIPTALAAHRHPLTHHDESS